jgi:hypothetical protein
MEIEQIIKKELDSLTRSLNELGYVTPDAYFTIGFFNEDCTIRVQYKSSSAFGAPEKNYYAHGNTFADCLADAKAHIVGMPSIADVRRKDFTVALANLIEMGRDIGIEEGFVNPLADMMKKLSTNIIEEKRS